MNLRGTNWGTTLTSLDWASLVIGPRAGPVQNRSPPSRCSWYRSYDLIQVRPFTRLARATHGFSIGDVRHRLVCDLPRAAIEKCSRSTRGEVVMRQSDTWPILIKFTPWLIITRFNSHTPSIPFTPFMILLILSSLFAMITMHDHSSQKLSLFTLCL